MNLPPEPAFDSDGQPVLDSKGRQKQRYRKTTEVVAAKLRGSKKARPLAETTVAHHHAMLKTAYNWALEEELLLVNPALRVRNPPALHPKTRPVWSMGEIARVVI